MSETIEQLTARVDQAIMTLKLAQRDVESFGMSRPLEMLIGVLDWVNGRESRFGLLIDGLRGVDESITRDEALTIAADYAEKLYNA